MKYKILFIQLFIFFSIGSTQVNEYVVDNFTNSKQSGNQIYSNGRTWTSFGGLSIGLKNGLIAKGSTNTWAGFGTDPGPGGNNGAIILNKNYNALIIDIEGTANQIKVEISDEKYLMYEYWLDMNSKSQTINLANELKNKPISKIQFVCAPGNIELKITSIKLK